jgi:hypothetical protein
MDQRARAGPVNRPCQGIGIMCPIATGLPARLFPLAVAEECRRSSDRQIQAPRRIIPLRDAMVNLDRGLYQDCRQIPSS